MERATQLILILAAIVIGYVLPILGKDTRISILILETVYVYQLLFWSIYFNNRYKRIYNFHFLVVLTFGFFLGPRIILDLLGQADIRLTNFFTNYKVSYQTIQITLTNINLAMYFFFLPSVFTKINLTNNGKAQGISKKNIQIWQKLSMLITPIIILIIYLKIKFLLENGYLAFHMGEEKILFSAFFELLIIFYYLMFIFQLFHLRKLNINIFWLHFITLTVVLASDGRRGPAMIQVLLTIYFLQDYYQKNISIRKLMIIGSFLATLLIFVGSLRFRNRGFDFSFVGFFYAQGISIQSIFYSIDYERTLNYKTIDLFSATFRSLKVITDKIIFYDKNFNLNSMIEDYKIYSTYLSSKVNSDMYYSGFGIGGSYIGELYAVGKEKAQIIGSFIMGLIYTKLVTLQHSNIRIEKKAIALIFIGSIVYIPRDNMLDFLAENVFEIIIAGFIGVLIRIKRI